MQSQWRKMVFEGSHWSRFHGGGEGGSRDTILKIALEIFRKLSVTPLYFSKLPNILFFRTVIYVYEKQIKVGHVISDRQHVHQRNSHKKIFGKDEGQSMKQR